MEWYKFVIFHSLLQCGPLAEGLLCDQTSILQVAGAPRCLAASLTASQRNGRKLQDPGTTWQKAGAHHAVPCHLHGDLIQTIGKHSGKLETVWES